MQTSRLSVVDVNILPSGLVRRGEEVQRVEAGEAAGGREGEVQAGRPADEEGHAEEEGQRHAEEEPEAGAQGEEGR